MLHFVIKIRYVQLVMVSTLTISYSLRHVCEGRPAYIIVVGSGIFFSCDKISVSEHLYQLNSRICLVGSYFSWAWGKRGGGREEIVV